MVKQYKDGYFLNGKWYGGTYVKESHDKWFNISVDVIDGPHTRPINGNGIIKVEHTEPIYLPDNAWSNGAYGEIEEPYDVQYITYLFYGIIVILVLAILFVLASF